MMQGLSKTRVAQALTNLSAPLATGQYWVLLPLAVAEGLGLLLEAGALKKRRELIAGLPSSIAAAFPEDLSLSAEQKTSLQNRAASLVQLVSREIEGLDVVELPGAEIAREVRASAPESISGRIADLLKPPSTLTPNCLADALKAELVCLLTPVLGDEAESIAGNLAEAIVVSLAEDPLLKTPFEEAHRAETRELARKVQTLLDHIGELDEGLRGLDRLVARAAGLPSTAMLMELLSWNREEMRGELLSHQDQRRAKELVLSISKFFFEPPQRTEAHLLDDSPLIAIRDALVEGLDSSGLLVDETIEASGDPVFRQFEDHHLLPDPFMLLCWEEERGRIRAQVASVAQWLAASGGSKKLPAEILKQLRQAQTEDGSIGVLAVALTELLNLQEPERGWKVEEYGPTLAAFLPGLHTEPSLILVPHGPFVAGDVVKSDELPVRLEEIESPFWTAFDPVRVADYLDFMRANDPGDKAGVDLKYDLSGPLWLPLMGAEAALGDRRQPWDWKGQVARQENPVVGLSWFEAAAYCLWLNSTRGWEEDPKSGPYRLPTEAQWEKAARGLFARRWPWGCVWRPELAIHGRKPELESLAVVVENRNLSPFGVRGMAGNAWEWTATEWAAKPFGRALSPASVENTDPIALRGASFSGDRRWLRCAYRVRVFAGYWGDFGFRCVRDVI